jgi:hypothetical protein
VYPLGKFRILDDTPFFSINRTVAFYFLTGSGTQPGGFIQAKGKT